jgi:hypothetical protein
MAIATGVAKQLRYKVEGTWGTAPGATGSQLLRRVSSDLALKKDAYESQEIVSHYQRLDYRHGVRRVEGSINGELSPGTYKDFMAAAVRKAWASVTAITGVALTIAGAGPTYTVTRGSGSWLSDGLKVGHVMRLSVGTLNAANISKNLLVVDIGSATVATVMPLNGVALVAEGPISGCTATVIGKVTYAPSSGHTDLSYAIEHWHADVSQSELFLGCKVASMDIDLPSSGMASINLGFLGKDVTTNSSAYYTSPTAETSTGILASVNGILVAGSGAIALVTGMSINYSGEMSGEPVVGSNTFAEITEGRVLISGQLTALFQDATIRDYFLNETEVGLVAALSASNAAAADFISFAVPRVKFGDAAKDDGAKALVQTLPFTALYNASGGSGVKTEQTTIQIQDSQA